MSIAAVLLNLDGNAEIMVVVEVAKFGDGDEFDRSGAQRQSPTPLRCN